jgi:hypothetical protein
MERIEVAPLTQKHSELLVKKGGLSGNANAEVTKKQSEVAAKGQAVVEKIRKKTEELTAEYDEKKEAYDKQQGQEFEDRVNTDKLLDIYDEISYIDGDMVEKLKAEIEELHAAQYKTMLEIPLTPNCPKIEDGKLQTENSVEYHPDFAPLFKERDEITKEYNEIKPEEVNYDEIEKEIEELNEEIEKAKANNTLIDRYELNRQWVDADGALNAKRQELAKMYAKVNTGVPGLKMMPFFNDEKMEIKTVYSGEYDKDFFKPGESEDNQLLLSYSSTQRPIIGVLLQVARLKLKSKMLPYIFIDDVPMDSRSREIIARIAEENNLTILTSMTGDFEKDKLTENEILIEGGEVFFNE